MDFSQNACGSVLIRENCWQQNGALILVMVFPQGFLKTVHGILSNGSFLVEIAKILMILRFVSCGFVFGTSKSFRSGFESIWKILAVTVFAIAGGGTSFAAVARR
jgi:O-antigen ligase